MHPSAQPRCRFLSDSVPRLPRFLMGKQGPPTMAALHMFEVLDLKPSPSARIERQNPCGSDTLFFCLPAKRNSSTTWEVPHVTCCRMSITSSPFSKVLFMSEIMLLLFFADSDAQPNQNPPPLALAIFTSHPHAPSMHPGIQNQVSYTK